MAIRSIHPTQLSLLLIEDGALLRKSLEEYLLLQGFAVTSARTRREALKAATRFPFDVILTDEVLPGSLQSDAFFRLLRNNSVNAATPVVSMTAWPNFTSSDSLTVLEKPFDLDVLARTLRKVSASTDQ